MAAGAAFPHPPVLPCKRGLDYMEKPLESMELDTPQAKDAGAASGPGGGATAAATAEPFISNFTPAPAMCMRVGPGEAMRHAAQALADMEEELRRLCSPCDPSGVERLREMLERECDGVEAARQRRVGGRYLCKGWAPVVRVAQAHGPRLPPGHCALPALQVHALRHQRAATGKDQGLLQGPGREGEPLQLAPGSLTRHSLPARRRGGLSGGGAPGRLLAEGLKPDPGTMPNPSDIGG